MAQIAAFDLDKILEALRAVRVPSVNIHGMLRFYERHKCQEEAFFRAWAIINMLMCRIGGIAAGPAGPPCGRNSA